MKNRITDCVKSIFAPERRYWLLLLYWLLFGLVFWPMEAMTGREYHTVESALDAAIPFCEWFVIPYYFWFLYIIGSMTYFALKNKETFVKYMWFVTISYSITLAVYAVYPTQQLLRPVPEGDGILLGIVRRLYSFDTCTNVCPSLHVIGSLAVCFSAFSCQRLKHTAVRVFYAAACVVICMSTVFLKQHSVIDIFWGIVVSALTYPMVFAKNKMSFALIKPFEAAWRGKDCVHKIAREGFLTHN